MVICANFPFVDVCVIDSVAALVPKGELEGDMGDNKLGLQARLMSQALRKLTGSINKTGCCCIFINQLREKIGDDFFKTIKGVGYKIEF
jgi:recombination protein RecA